jgi:acetate kinase
MGTRSGDLDPAVVGYLMERENLEPGEVDTILNKRSGLLGITEGANDMREVIECMIEGRERHTLAYRMFCRRVKKYIGAYIAVLGGLDALVFTGGIGENSALVRRDILTGLKCLGFELDDRANEENRQVITRGRVPALVIPTNEELAIARDAREIIEHSLAAAESGEEGAGYAEELSALTPADRRELVLLWSADPTANPLRLQERFAHKTGRRLSLGSLQYELVRMGLKEKEEHHA